MNDVASPDKLARIRELNDKVRRGFTGGRIMITAGVAALPDVEKAKVVEAFRSFDAFNEDNDPHGEHDMVFLDVEGSSYIGKCDYYDVDERYLSDDPSDPTITKRVWVLMRADEY
jgi:hypothetical protein